MKRAGIILVIMGLAIGCFAGQPIEIPELKKIFDKYKVEGSILIYNQNENSKEQITKVYIPIK